MDNDDSAASSALSALIGALSPLDKVQRQRVLTAAAAFFNLASPQRPPNRTDEETNPDIRHSRPTFSTSPTVTPKEFLLTKQPRTDVERVACLAFYLTHYRETPYFKTIDLAKLNTEAAQPKFSNTAYSATNAANMGYLAPGMKGQRQLSAAGEEFVRALPDREAARAAMARARPKKLRAKKR
ncbi:hypothetical protein JQ636_04305 [Bradyrhizobium japonicum]|uniref:hypothetical protein n=1 Tax=Bradyrhizobium japonicum TaxID=375 RepID=UPI001BA64971|nr:hypothetical protein [Bradyrhizobium japonicum]MBR0728305.1 hypothetical protein [Bradyrhizobium japonicum]MBR0802751.1 hypothetical protein [Bradyrhizobium japonicum]